MPIVNIDRSLVAGIQNHLMETWRQKMPVFQKQQERLFRILPGTGPRSYQEVWKESVPFPSYWAYGAKREIKGFRDRYLSVGKHNYSLVISWSQFDEEDDQLGDIKTQVNTAVDRFGMLPDVLASEYFNGTAVLNREILSAYDGASLFSATDGDGNDRLGASGGNIVPGSGLSTDAIVHDFAVAQQRLLSFVDPTAERPIFSPDEVAYEKMFAIVPKELNEVFVKASNSENIKISSDNLVSESNWIKGKFDWQANPYLSDSSDWYIVVEHPYWKPFVYRSPDNIKQIIADMNNSDHARDTGENAMFSHIRTWLGIWFPGIIIKVNN